MSGTKQDLIRYRIARTYETLEATRILAEQSQNSTSILLLKAWLTKRFGKYICSYWHGGKKRSEDIAFKFNPSQKLKAALGWSSTYTGDI